MKKFQKFLALAIMVLCGAMALRSICMSEGNLTDIYVINHGQISMPDPDFLTGVDDVETLAKEGEVIVAKRRDKAPIIADNLQWYVSGRRGCDSAGTVLVTIYRLRPKSLDEKIPWFLR